MVFYFSSNILNYVQREVPDVYIFVYNMVNHLYKVKSPYLWWKLSRKGVKRVRWPTKVLSGRVSKQMYDAVLDIVHKGNFVDVTDYLRDLVRKDLEARGLSIED